MGGMFSGAGAFDQDLGEWDLGALTSDNSSGSGIGGGTNMLDKSGLSMENWDATLKGWHDQSLTKTEPVTIGADGLVYCSAAGERAGLIQNNFKITGDRAAILPKASCRAAKLQLGFNGGATLDPSLVDGGSEGCGIEPDLNRTQFTTADIGTRTVTLTVSDPDGTNPDSCNATVTVEAYTTETFVTTWDTTNGGV